MFCIATFIVFGILAIFSATSRPLAAKAWHCALRRMTFRPCDISFGEEMKGKLVGKLVYTHPRLARFINRWIDWLSLAFVILSIWSLLYVFYAGLNLWVYDTCDPRSAESCSLSGEACGIDQTDLGVWELFQETVSRIPDRLKTWKPEEYLGPSATFYRPFDAKKPVAIEIIDPGCKFCKKLTKNMKDAGVMDAVNVSYLLYPIPKTSTGGTKFPHSGLVAAFIEATKLEPLPHANNNPPADWQLLEKIFAEAERDDIDLQTSINVGMTQVQVRLTLLSLLKEIGYNSDQIKRIESIASSKQVQDSLTKQRVIVEDSIRTIKIPTLLLGGRRFDRVVNTKRLSTLL